jgi:hypothetical protein
MTPIMYAAHAAAWSLVGLAAVPHVAVDRLVDAQPPEVFTMPDKIQPPRKRRWWKAKRGNVVMVLLVLFALVSTAWSAVLQQANAEQDRRAEATNVCLRSYANGFADAIEARGESAAEAQSALDELVAVVGGALGSGATTPTTVKQAVDKYLGKRSEQRAAQQENPYPPPPRDLCE